jgi:GR25 family glycosyltransferase involved in LPS biosynthesis
MLNRIDKIFIIHYPKLAERKQYLLDIFKQYNITNYEFYEENSRDTIKPEKIDMYLKKGVRMRIPHICITISHIEIYKKIIENDYKMCLILEDDAILCANFIEQFNNYINVLPNDFELGFINSGCGLHAKTIENTIWYKEYRTRTCCGYIITNTACKKLLTTIIPFRDAIDHELNRQILIHNIQTYWCEPVLINDGSGREYNGSY